MPLTYTIDVSRRLVLTKGEGKLSYEECAAHATRLRSDPLFSPDFRQLLDLSNVEVSGLKSVEVKRVAELQVFAPHARRAILAPDNAVYGMGRMFELYRDCEGETGIRVCRDRAEALAWLELGE